MTGLGRPLQGLRRWGSLNVRRVNYTQLATIAATLLDQSNFSDEVRTVMLVVIYILLLLHLVQNI